MAWLSLGLQLSCVVLVVVFGLAYAAVWASMGRNEEEQ